MTTPTIPEIPTIATPPVAQIAAKTKLDDKTIYLIVAGLLILGGALYYQRVKSQANKEG